MSLTTLLQGERKELLEDAVQALGRARLPHYEQAGSEVIRQRLGALLDLTIDAIHTRNVSAIVAHAAKVAEERFKAGVDLSETQTAFNVLEESLWLRILSEVPVTEQAEALGLVGTVLGSGKDALARKWVALATHALAPSLDLKALFRGTESLVC